MTTDGQFEQIIQYFFLLTENHLAQTCGASEGKRLSEKFKQRFRDIYSESEKKMPDALSRQHGINPVFVMAFADTLKEKGISFDDLRGQVMSIFETLLESSGVLKNQAETMGLSDDPWNAFLEWTNAGNKLLYDNEYFELEVVETGGTRFGFDIHRCLYVDIFRANGCPDLAPILCEYDYILARNMEQWVKFERTETVADGDPRCDFRYTRK